MGLLWVVAMVAGYTLGWRPAELHFVVILAALSVTVTVIGRTRPLTAIIAVGVVALSPVWSYDAPELRSIPLAIVAYAAARTGAPRLAAIPMLAVITIASLLPFIPLGDFNFTGYLQQLTLYDPSLRILAGVTVAAAYLLGAAARTQAEQLEELQRRNAELVRLREADRERIAAEERTHIAREIHDVVAHHIAAIVVRAQAAAHLGFRRPTAADTAAGEHRQAELQRTVEGIAVSGQEALAAMRRVVRVLRTDAEAPSRTATTFAASLEEVAARLRDAGLTVDLNVQAGAGTASALPEVVEFAVVRIVQESLSNVLLHSTAERASVSVAAEADIVIVTIDDDGASGQAPRAPFPAADRDGSGDGVRGMRERAEALGGSLSAGPTDAGWQVRAELPLVRMAVTA